jgi:hypothetical protein
VVPLFGVITKIYYTVYMAELKTKVTKASAVDFIRRTPDKNKRRDALVLLTFFKNITGEKPKMWGSSIIGFGLYHYKSERSTQEGDWPLTGFSPRKQNLTLYVMSGFSEDAALLKKLGKHKRSVGCLYINKLEDVDLSILKQIIKKSFLTMKKRHA